MQHAPGTVFRVVPDELARPRVYQQVAVHAYGGGGGGGGYSSGGVSIGGGAGGGASSDRAWRVPPGVTSVVVHAYGGSGAGGSGGSHAPHVYCGSDPGSCPCGLPGAHAAGP